MLYVSASYIYLLGAINYYTGSVSTDAYLMVKTLEELRAGKTEKAIQSLESGLDSKIVENTSYRPGMSRIFSLFVITDEKPRRIFMQRVAEYRDKYPPVSTTPQVLEVILNHLNNFKKSEK